MCERLLAGGFRDPRLDPEVSDIAQTIAQLWACSDRSTSAQFQQLPPRSPGAVAVWSDLKVLAQEISVRSGV
ncbi:hypothetical protein J6590_035295 [Homalodisca vitripennis]|nr:hypothetical protein J6590_035295 [Homalodisca vitripennis]